jgi:hypothetical protein
VLDLLVDLLYSMRRWRALLAWAITAALIYPVITYMPNQRAAWNLAFLIGIIGFVGGLYWEFKSPSERS